MITYLRRRGTDDRMRAGQSFSLDVVLAVVIFGFISVVFASIALIDRPDIKDLQATAEEVVYELQGFDACGQVIGENDINDTGIECLYSRPYDDVKKSMRVKGNFCVYMEDEQGRLLPVNTSDGVKSSWGSAELKVAGDFCGK